MQIPEGPSLSPPELMQIFLSNPFPFFEECRQSYGNIFSLDLGNSGYRTTNTNGLWVLVNGQKYNSLLAKLNRKITLPGAASAISNAGLLPTNYIGNLNGANRARLHAALRKCAKHFAKHSAHSISPFDRKLAELSSGSSTRKHDNLRGFLTELVYSSLFNTFFGDDLDDQKNLKQVLLQCYLSEPSVAAIRLAFQDSIPALNALIDLKKKRLVKNPTSSHTLSYLDSSIFAQSNGSRITDEEIRDNTICYYVLFSQAILAILGWSIVWLTREPEALKKALEEIHRIEPINDSSISNVDTLYPYLHALVSEVCRLSPMSSIHSEQLLTQHVNLNGLDIPKGSIIASVPFLTHTDPSLFENPLSFEPTRFLKQNYNDQALNPSNIGGKQTYPWSNSYIKKQATALLIPLLKTLTIEKLKLGVVPELSRSVYMPISLRNTSPKIRESSEASTPEFIS